MSIHLLQRSRPILECGDLSPLSAGAARRRVTLVMDSFTTSCDRSQREKRQPGSPARQPRWGGRVVALQIYHGGMAGQLVAAGESMRRAITWPRFAPLVFVVTLLAGAPAFFPEIAPGIAPAQQ